MRRHKQPPTYQYKDLELAMARNFKVNMQDLPAFRARIRHLRNLGVPKHKKPGSGQKISYSRADAIQLLIALEAELLGLPPKVAASFSAAVMETHAKKAEAAAQHGRRYIVSVEPSFSFNYNDAAIFFSEASGSVPVVDDSIHRRMIINLATSITLLDAYLQEAIEKSRTAITGA